MTHIGVKFGIAALATVAASTTSDALASGRLQALALAGGFAAFGVLAALALIRRNELERPGEEAVPLADAA